MSEQNTVELRPAGDGMVTIETTWLLCGCPMRLSVNDKGARVWTTHLDPLKMSEADARDFCAHHNLTIIEPTTTNSASTGSKLVDGSESRSSSQGLLDDSKDAGAEGEKSQYLFPTGTRVVKSSGDYTFEGVVVSAFTKQSGATRYVVEDDRGLLFIFGEPNLSRVAPASPADAGESVEASIHDMVEEGQAIPVTPEQVRRAEAQQSASKGEVRRWQPWVNLGIGPKATPHIQMTEDDDGEYVLNSDYERDIAERDERIVDLRAANANLERIVQERESAIAQLQRDHAAEVERLKTRLVGLPSAYANVAEWQQAWESLDDERTAEIARLTKERDEWTATALSYQRERDEARADAWVMREKLERYAYHNDSLRGQVCNLCDAAARHGTRVEHRSHCLFSRPNPGASLVEELARLRVACSAIHGDICDRLMDADSPGTRQTLEQQRRMLERAISGKDANATA